MPANSCIVSECGANEQSEKQPRTACAGSPNWVKGAGFSAYTISDPWATRCREAHAWHLPGLAYYHAWFDLGGRSGCPSGVPCTVRTLFRL